MFYEDDLKKYLMFDQKLYEFLLVQHLQVKIFIYIKILHYNKYFILDTLAERDSFIENIFPKLKDYCREKYGLEFQVMFYYFNLE